MNACRLGRARSKTAAAASTKQPSCPTSRQIRAVRRCIRSLPSSFHRKTAFQLIRSHRIGGSHARLGWGACWRSRGFPRCAAHGGIYPCSHTCLFVLHPIHADGDCTAGLKMTLHEPGLPIGSVCVACSPASSYACVKVCTLRRPVGSSHVGWSRSGVLGPASRCLLGALVTDCAPPASSSHPTQSPTHHAWGHRLLVLSACLLAWLDPNCSPTVLATRRTWRQHTSPMGGSRAAGSCHT